MVRKQRGHETQAEPTAWEATPESTRRCERRSEGAM